MEFFFADDTKQKSSREGMGDILGFGGIFVGKDALSEVDRQVRSIRDSFGIPQGEEIKWSPKKGSWIYENLHDERRVECYSAILQVARDLGCKVMVIAWDEGRTSLKGDDAFQRMLDYAFERITMRLSKINKLGLIIADKPGGGAKDDTKFISRFLTRIYEGTSYVPPTHVPINILTTPSHLQVHLQVADLVTAITCAMVAGHDKYAAKYFDIIKPMFIENAYGYIGGTGLKLCPNDLVNLYFHVLGEDTFARVAMASGWTLPRKGFPYNG